jgi:cation-transporting ATPase 13A1
LKPPEALRDTIQTLAAAHALVRLDDNIVGDPMEKATLEALEWKLDKGILDIILVVFTTSLYLYSLIIVYIYTYKLFSLTDDTVIPANQQSQRFQSRSKLQIRRRFQFSSALKRMSSVSTVTTPRGKKTFIAVKGAPETLRHMYAYVPDDYEETFKFFTRRGSRVLALGYKYLQDNMSLEQVFSSIM